MRPKARPLAGQQVGWLMDSERQTGWERRKGSHNIRFAARQLAEVGGVAAPKSMPAGWPPAAWVCFSGCAGTAQGPWASFWCNNCDVGLSHSFLWISGAA